MWSFNLVRWLRSSLSARKKTIEKKPRFRLSIEELENRLAPAAFIWTGNGADTNWNTNANWQGGAAPQPATPATDLIFGNSASAGFTSVNNITGLVVNSIQISGGASPFDLSGNSLTLGDPGTPGSGTIQVGSFLTGERIGMDIQLAATSSSQQFFTVGQGADLTLSGKLTGTSGSQLTKEGAGTLILTNDNSGYVGPFNIDHDAGIVRISHAKALGVSTNTVTVGNNSQLQLNSIGAANPIGNTLKLFGAGVNSDGSLVNLAGSNVWSGPIQIGSNTSFNEVTGSTLTITGSISDLGSPFNVTKSGRGELILANANSYRGSTTVADGTLTLAHPQALGSVPAAGTSVVRNTLLDTIGTLKLQFDSTIAPNGPASSQYWTLQDPTQAFDAVNNPYVGFVVNDVPLTLNGAGFVVAGNPQGALWNALGNNTWTGTVTLGSDPPVGANVTVNVDAAANQTRLFLTGVVQDPSPVPAAGPFDLTKIGNGDLVLSPTAGSVGTANTYRGLTTISNGTVTLRDSQGLGPQTKRHISNWATQSYDLQPIVTVASGAGLNLESNVGHIDSVTSTVNRLQVASPVGLNGTGFNGLGALHSISGINTYVEKFFTAPTGLSANDLVAAVGLAPGQTYWVVTALDGYGESLASPEATFLVVAGRQNVTLSWSSVAGATGYKLYRSTTQGTYGANSLVATVNGVNNTSFTDTGTALTAGTPPSTFPIINLPTDAAIGVDADPNQTADNTYFTKDYSLTVTGGIAGGTSSFPTNRLLTKVRAGHLILPNANQQFFGSTTISAGWITIQDPAALGGPNPSVQEVQPTVTVNFDAALMLRPYADGTSFTFTHNMVLQGMGIHHAYSKIDQQGAVENLAGVNTLNSNIQLKGPVGIGVEEVFGRSNLVSTGEISQGQGALNFAGDAGGNRNENIGPGVNNGVNTGSTSGRLVLNAFVHTQPDDIRVYMGNWKLDPANARLIYDASNDFVSVRPTPVNRGGASITIDYTATTATIDVVHVNDPGIPPFGAGAGPGQNWLYAGLGPQAISFAPVSGLYATWITIVVNPGGNSSSQTQWRYTAQITPAGNFGGMIKLGSQRLELEGPGVYMGGVEIRNGVVRVENNTGLGARGNAGTIVQPGTALELANPTPDSNGGQSIGAAIWDTPLSLNGTGNSIFGDSALTVLGKDNLWHGPITLNSSIALSFKGTLANQAINTLTSSAGGVTVVTSTPGGGGVNAVQTLTFAGVASGSTFTLTYDDGVGAPVTTGSITYSTNPSTLITNIINRLNPVLGANNFGIALVSPTININPNSRLLVTGAITDPTNPTTAGTDLIMDGGGSLFLSGTNTYRGTTLVNQGTLTIQNGAALGGPGIAGQQQIALVGAVAGSTQFRLSYAGGTQTSAITYTGTPADAATIQTRLSDAGILPAGGTATVVALNPGNFLVTFGGTLAGTTTLLAVQITSGLGSAGVSSEGGTYIADKAQLQLQGGITVSGEPLLIQGAGNNVASAIQTFTIGSTAVIPTGAFSLDFNGSDTGPLPYNITAGQLQAALQNLSSVKNVAGQVVVNIDTIYAGTNEEQRVLFTGFNVGDTYQLYFDPASGAQQLGYNLTAPITYTGNAFTEKNNIVAALGNLQVLTNIGGTISGIAAAGVSGGVEFADFVFTGALADQDVGSAQVFALTGAGTPTVSEFVKGATGYRTFSVGFQGSFDGQAQPTMTAGASGVSGSTTMTAPVTTLVGGSANATPTQWFAQGPAPIANAVVNGGAQPTGNQLTTGRVTGVDVQQGFAGDIYIATADGGFWRTVDGGTHWTPVFDNINGSVIFGGAVTIAQTANSTVYFGTGEGNNSADSYYGSGVYSASTRADLATTITTKLVNPDGSNPLAGKAINKIVVNPNNPLMIWVAVSDRATNGSTGNAGIWRYNGTNWLNMTPPGAPTTNYSYSDVAIENNGATLRLYAALGNPTAPNSNDVRVTNNPDVPGPTWNAGGVFSAAVGGTTGTIKLATVAGGVFGTAYAAVSNPAGNSMDVFRTTNGGTSWAKTGANPANYLAGQGNYAISIVARRVGGNDLVFVAGHDAGAGTNFVIRSANGGGAWADRSKDANNVGPHTDVHALALTIDPLTNTPVLVAGTDGGVWRFDDAASTWANLNGNLNITNLNSVASQPGNSGILLAGTQANGTARYDGTSAWSQVDPGVSSATLVRYSASDPNIAYSLFGGIFRRSTTGGSAWIAGAAQSDFAIDLVNSNRVLLGSAGASVGESMNAGASSILLNSPANGQVAAATYQGPFLADSFFPSVGDVGANTYVPDTIYVANTNNIFLTKNHGVTWTFRTGGITGATNATPIVITSNNHGLQTGQRVIITGVAVNTNANGLFTINVVDANRFELVGSAGNGVGVGGTWTLADRAPPLQPGTTIQDLIVDPSNSNVLYVVAAGRVTAAGTGRVFKSSDSGRTWTDISSGLPLSAHTGLVLPVWTVVHDYRTNDLYAGTDEGVWKLTGGSGNWQRFGAGLPVVQVKDLDLNPSMNVLTAATYGRGAWQFTLDDNTLPNAPTYPGALRSVAGKNTWNGPIVLAGPTTISANGSQALQNGLSAASLNVFGIISDLTTTNANTLTKIGGGDVILSGPNTYAGVTDIQQGNLVVRDPSALGGAAIAGVQAISVQATAAPTLVTSALSASAGTLSAGTTYYYVVTAVGPYGESIASSQTSFTTSAPSQAIDLSWHVVDGATGYYVYRSTTSGSFGERLAPITSGTTTSFTDTGTAGTSNSPPVLQFTISIRNGGNTYTTGPITYTGVPASDAAAIVGVLTPGFFNTAGFSGGTAAVVSLNAGMFRVTFGGTLANQPTPVLIPAVTSPAGSFTSVSVTPGGGTIVEPNAALVLESSLYLEPVTVNAHGIPLTYSGHNTGALRSSSNVNTYTGTLTLNTNSTIGVDSGSSLTLANAAPIVITSANHGLATGQTIAISNVQGNTAANGSWTVTVIDVSRFSLNGSLGNGNYSSGGTWTATSTGAVTAASNAAPIVVTSNGHGLVNGQKVSITGVLGNTAANNTVGNPTWTVAGASANTFQLVGSTGNGAYTSGGTWTLVASGAITAATNAVSITDNGVGFSLDKESTGTLVLASAGSYGTNTTAGTMVNQGVLNVQNSNALGVAGSTTTVRDGAQLQLQSAANAPINVATENLVLSGSGITGTGAMRNVVGNNSWGSPTTTVTLTSVPGFSPTTRPAGTVAFSVANLGDTLTIGSPVVEPAALSATPTSGPLSMGLVKLGPGRLTLTQSDSYSGTTYVNAGILSVQNAGALGANDGDDVQRITVFSTLPTDQFTLTFNGQTTGLLTYGVPPFGGATPTASVQNALNALSSINGGGGSVSVTQSNISFTTPTGVTTGIVYTVTFGGPLAKKAQPLISATPAGGTSIAVSRVADGGVGTRVSTGASLELDGDPLHNNSSISLPATQRLWLNGAGSAALYGITAASQVVGGTTVTATVVSTAGLFTGETVTIAGFTPSGYNGTFTITVVDATRFRYEAPAGLAAVTVLGSATASPGALRNVSGNNTWTGPVFLQTSSSIGADPTTRFSVTGTIQDPPTSVANPIPSPAPAADLTKVGTGTLVFPNANTYAGNTLVNSGVLNIQHNTALGGTTSAIQTINVLGTSGQYHLTYNGVNTIDLSIGASAAQVKAALDTAIQTATGNAANNVTVTQNGNVYTVYFNGGALAMTAQPMLTATLGAGVTVVDITAVQLGAESSTVVATGATLQMEGGITESSGKSIILNGPGFGGAGALDSVAGNNTASTLPLLLGSTSAIGADGSSRLTIDQLITDQFQTQSIQFSTLFPSNGAYTLSFDGATTPTLNFNSGSTTAARTANAKAIEDALNALPTIALRGGVVSVAVPSSGRTYVATFGGRMIGTNWPTIIRTSSSTITITRTMNAGNFGVNKVGLSTVQYAGATANSYSGLTDVHSGVLELAKTGGALALTNNLQIGDTTPVSQVQALDLSGLAYGDVFTLSYNSSPASAPLTYYTNPAYEAAQIQAALNALPTIGGLATPGSVTVVPNGANKFLITFGGSLAGVRAFTPVQAVKGATTIDATLQTAGAVPVLDFAQVLYLGNNQIATSSDVLINNDGLWNLGGFAQTLSPTGSLTMIGGDVQLPTTSNLTIGSGAGAATLTATSDTVRSSRIQGAGRVTLGGTAANFFDIGDGPQDSDLIFSAGLQDSGQGFNKINTGRLEVNALEGATLTGRTRIDAGDVQVDGIGSTQIITLTNAVANTTTLAVTLNGVSSPSFTYTGVAATDGPALKAAIVALGVPSANVTVTPDVTDTIFT
ncbi:MAG: hypothetical protein FJ303_10335, partial [Planctomycetes bacterium]|nr:hypothetical protein [Planctomycetota bacterium]